jgi:alanine racemase
VLRALARVDLAAIERNCARLASAAAPAALCAVVKADGYGHGAVPAARAAQAGGAAWLAVATAAEAAELRAAGVEGPLLVLGALSPEELDVALAAAADVACWREEAVEGVGRRARELGVQAGVHVKLDTGMGRLGTRDAAEASRAVAAVAAAPALRLAGAFTHFATADEDDPAFLREQLERFTVWVGDVRAAHPDVLVHAANSAATLAEPAARLDMVRCGVAIYGLDPFQKDPGDHGLEPALSLSSYVAAVKWFKPGESAGYGRRWRAGEGTWVAVIPIGYGDGWRRALTNNADVLIRGTRHPLVGTVSMDNITVELGPDTEVEVGDEVVLIGSQGSERILAEEVAERIGTINYEVTCGIGRRVRYLHEQ